MYVYANTVVSSNMSSRFAWLYKIVQKVRITYLLLRQVGKSALSKVLLGRHFSNKELFSYFSLKWKPSAHLNNYIKLLIIYCIKILIYRIMWQTWFTCSSLFHPGPVDSTHPRYTTAQMRDQGWEDSNSGTLVQNNN